VTVSIQVPPEIEAGLISQAEAHGLSLDEYLRRFLLEQFADNARPAQSSGASGVLEKEGDVWVLRTGQPISASAMRRRLTASVRSAISLTSDRFVEFLPRHICARSRILSGASAPCCQHAAVSAMQPRKRLLCRTQPGRDLLHPYAHSSTTSSNPGAGRPFSRQRLPTL